MNKNPLWPVVALFLSGGFLLGADWPMWRYDAGRTANSPEQLPENLHLHWTRNGSPRVPVWDNPLNRDLMPYDRIFEPVVSGERMFVGFNDADKLMAIDIRTGEELWSFYTDGPVRLPPVAWEEKVYFVSDDGRLYCVKAADGSLVWQFRGGPSEQKVVGNRRVISAWPARGAPVIRDGKVYFAASIWPFMGVFIYALDAQTGDVVWVNDGTGANFIKQPHGAESFAGVAPQGALVATADVLLVPGGRSVPAGFDRHTGKLLHFEIDAGGKGNGGSFVIADDSTFYVHTRDRGVRSFELKKGKKGRTTLNEPVLAGDLLYTALAHTKEGQAAADAESALIWVQRDEAYSRFELGEAEADGDEAKIKKARENLAKAVKKTEGAQTKLQGLTESLTNGWQGRVIQAWNSDREVVWSLPADGLGDLIKAGDHLYAAGTSNLVSIRLPRTEDEIPEIVWTHPTEGRILRLLAANGMLFAITLDGRIMAFGETRRTPVERSKTIASPPRSRSPARAEALLGRVKLRGMVAFCFGLDDGELFRGLAASSPLQLVGLDSNGKLIGRLRREFDAADWYGKRVALHQIDPAMYNAPAYVADLVVVGAGYASRLESPSLFKSLFESVRPYGGVMWVEGHGPSEIAQWVQRAGLANSRVETDKGGTFIFRDGALPGSADWTHQYGDVANTVKSDDAVVKAPLGLLWFGGNSNEDVLPRHGHGPPEQVVNGLMFVEGMNSLSCRDVYTGRGLWHRDFGDLGTFGIYYDDSYTNSPLNIAYNQKHIPGANGRGCNYVATSNALYLAISNTCQVLDPLSGNTVRTITIPGSESEDRKWAFIGVYEDVLLGGTGFAHFRRRFVDPSGQLRPSIEDYSASRGLAGFDRITGELLWKVEARHSFIHNGIVAGNGRVYVLDRLPRSAEEKIKRRGRSVPNDYRIAALDHRTGQVIWQADTNIFGSWLSFSEEHDLLLQAGASARDRSRDEVSAGMLVYQGGDGMVKWADLERKFTGPAILHNDLIITTVDSGKVSNGAFSLLDGTPHLISNPLTGRMEPWRITRAYGCNTVIASEHLLTFRSGAAGYYDLKDKGGTGNIGGFKSSCTSNLVIANGVLNAPDYTRTCSCAYQNQTSLALVHMPGIEIWTYSKYGHDSQEGERINQVGINLGAPGDRRAGSGTLWLDHPSVGGESPGLGIDVSGENLTYFRRHSSHVFGHNMPWIVASGAEGVERITIRPEVKKPEKKRERKRRSRSDEDEDEDEDEPKENGGDKAEGDKAEGNKAGGDKAEGDKAEGDKAGGSATGGATAGDEAPGVVVVESEPVIYTVRLHFLEPGEVGVGERVFDVFLQDRPVLSRLDVLGETGSPYLGLMKECRGVLVQDDLVIRLVSAEGSKRGPVLCGIELVAEHGANP